MHQCGHIWHHWQLIDITCTTPCQAVVYRHWRDGLASLPSETIGLVQTPSTSHRKQDSCSTGTSLDDLRALFCQKLSASVLYSCRMSDARSGSSIAQYSAANGTSLARLAPIPVQTGCSACSQ